jgi:hypothetical protein
LLNRNSVEAQFPQGSCSKSRANNITYLKTVG